MEQQPEKEEVYQNWRQSEHDIGDCFYEVEGSDFYEEGDMRNPTRKMIQETIAFVEANRPNWRSEVRDNDFTILLRNRYPELEHGGYAAKSTFAPQSFRRRTPQQPKWQIALASFRSVVSRLHRISLPPALKQP